MIRYYLIFIVFVTCLSYQSYAKQQLNDKFFEQINKAELAIVNKHPEVAYKIYKGINFQELRLNDLNNFYLLAIKTKNIKVSIEICHEIAKRGVGINYFKKSIFTPLKNNTAFLNAVKNADEFRNLIKENARNLTSTIDSLYKVDQAIATRRTSEYQGREIPVSILDSFDTNTAYLIELVKKSGFPSEGNIAPEIHDDTIYYFKNFYLLIAVHCLQVSTNDLLKSECRRTILNAVRNNEISHKDFLFIEGFGNLLIPESLGENSFAYDPIAKKFWQNKYLNTESLININKTRALYSIPSIKDDSLKIKFRNKNPDYQFSTTIKNVLVNQMNESDLAKFHELYLETTELR